MGDRDATYLAGKAYELGGGTSDQQSDLHKAAHYYTKASGLGSLNGQYHQGYLMARGYYDDVTGKPTTALPFYMRTEGESMMRNAIVNGYNPRLDTPTLKKAEQGVAAGSGSADTQKAVLAVGALAFATALLSSGGSTAGPGTNSQPGTGTQGKYCMVPDTVRNVDGSIAWKGQRAGYGYECP